MNSEPNAVELTVDHAWFIAETIGAGSFPWVLAITTPYSDAAQRSAFFETPEGRTDPDGCRAGTTVRSTGGRRLDQSGVLSGPVARPALLGAQLGHRLPASCCAASSPSVPQPRQDGGRAAQRAADHVHRNRRRRSPGAGSRPLRRAGPAAAGAVRRVQHADTRRGPGRRTAARRHVALPKSLTTWVSRRRRDRWWSRCSPARAATSRSSPAAIATGGTPPPRSG